MTRDFSNGRSAGSTVPNALVMGQNLHSISSLEFDTYNENGTGYGYQADTRRPSLDNLSITALKAFDAFDYDNSSLQFSRQEIT